MVGRLSAKETVYQANSVGDCEEIVSVAINYPDAIQGATGENVQDNAHCIGHVDSAVVVRIAG